MSGKGGSGRSVLAERDDDDDDNLLKRLNHAWEYTDITDLEIEIILTCRKSIIAYYRRTKVKSHVNNSDVLMGANDSAEFTDLIGIYILDTLGRIVNLGQVGL